MKRWVRCTLTIFTLLAAIPRAPAVITHYVGTPVEIINKTGCNTWYLDGAAETIELCIVAVLSRLNPADPTVLFEDIFFPVLRNNDLRLIADGGNPQQVARLSAGATFDASAPLVQLTGRLYPALFEGGELSFADGLWGKFEANAAASGYFAFRFDLNADGDDLTEQLQYGWARITFPAIVETDAFDPYDSITIHEWGWANIGDTDFRIGEQPSPPAPLLSIAQGSAGSVDIFWPGTSTVYQLQHADDLITTNWMNTPETAVLDGITNTVNTPTSADFRFYRLTE